MKKRKDKEEKRLVEKGAEHNKKFRKAEPSVKKDKKTTTENGEEWEDEGESEE